MELLTGTGAEQPVPARVTLYVTLQPELISCSAWTVVYYKLMQVQLFVIRQQWTGVPTGYNIIHSGMNQLLRNEACFA